MAVRASLAMALCIVVWMIFGNTLAKAALPLLRWTYELVDSQHSVRRLELSGSGAAHGKDRVLLLEVAPNSVVLVGKRPVRTRPDSWARISVLVAYLWQPISVAMAVAMAWPVTRASEWAVRVALLLLALPLTVVVDLPFVLWGEVWRLYQPMFAPGDVYPLLLWSDLLQGGGRYVLGVVVGAIACGLGACISGNKTAACAASAPSKRPSRP